MNIKLLLLLFLPILLVGCSHQAKQNNAQQKQQAAESAAKPVQQAVETNTDQSAPDHAESAVPDEPEKIIEPTPVIEPTSVIPTGLMLPFAIADIDEQNGEVNPIGVVRFSKDEGGTGHSGLDVPLFPGRNIRAVADGEIVFMESNIDPWGGEEIFQLLSPTRPGEGWGYLYEHVKVLDTLTLGTRVNKGDVIAISNSPTGFTTHLQLSYLFNNHLYIRDVKCWPDYLAAADKSTLDNWWAGYSASSHLQNSWRTNIEEGQYPFLGLLNTDSYPNGPQLCYPLGTDVRN